MLARVVAGVVATAAILVLASDNREPRHLSRAGMTYTCTYQAPEHVDAEAFSFDMDDRRIYCYDN